MKAKTDTIHTSVSELYLDENKIVHIDFPQRGVILREEDSREIYERRITLPTTSTKQMLLVDIRNNPNPDRMARDFTRSKEVKESTKALALLVGNPLSRLLGNFLLGFNKGDFPVKLFTTENEAVAWLLFKV